MVFKLVDGRFKSIVPLKIKPYTHQKTPTLIGSTNGTFYGCYSMDYKLPDGDCLRLFANHNKSAIQIVLITSDSEKIKKLPGKRQASLVANTISQINRYLIHSNHYPKPRQPIQIKKYELAARCIEKLQMLLSQERAIQSKDWSSQEALRADIIEIIEECSQANRILANHPLASEGELGSILYETNQLAQQYQFNRVYPVSKIDQLDFNAKKLPSGETPFLVWDSELYVENEDDLLDSLRMIADEYHLNLDESLQTRPPNRINRFIFFLKKIWHDCRNWVDYLASSSQFVKEEAKDTQVGKITVTQITPHYHFEGLSQEGYVTVSSLIKAFDPTKKIHALKADSEEKALSLLNHSANGSYIDFADKKKCFLRLDNQIICIHYFKENNLYFPLPTGEDLVKLCRLGKEHLFFLKRASLRLKSFFSQIPLFFISLFKNLVHFVSHDLAKQFHRYIDEGHKPLKEDNSPQNQRVTLISYLNSLEEILLNKGLLNSGQSLEDFVKERLRESPYVFVRERHPKSPPAYDNPIHRIFGVIRHVAHFFIDTSEKNPIIGTLAMAAYVYGAGAILAPELLTKILTKLHLSGLIKGIAPTQAFGHWMSNSPFSEAVSAAVTYWQAIIAAGSLDQFFIEAVEVLKEDPAEIAIIVALAISLGYGLCKAIPALKEEVGTFPYINYGILGAKGGAAIYDTIMHPGSDWLLGTIKWLLKGGLTIAKLIAGPFVEAYYYGFHEGFLKGLKKGGLLLLNTLKQVLAGIADLILDIVSIPFNEIAALFIHVPFIGIMTFLTKTFSILGNWQILGKALIEYAKSTNDYIYFWGFRLSPLYGFQNPLGQYLHNRALNFLINIAMVIVLPLLEIIKNFILLPSIDISSFTIRLLLSIADPLSRVLAFIFGNMFYYSGFIWDNSFGFLFRSISDITTGAINSLEHSCSTIKQFVNGGLSIVRRQIYDWAFGEMDPSIHIKNTDTNIDPMSLERLPHEPDDCLYEKLLPLNITPEPHLINDTNVEEESSDDEKKDSRFYFH